MKVESLLFLRTTCSEFLD